MPEQAVRKKIRVNRMLSDEACTAIAQNTWEQSDAGREEQRRWAERKTGDKMPDGSIYLGEDGGQDWFVTATDLKGDIGRVHLALCFEKAEKRAKNLHAHGHDDWKLPDRPILQKMFNARSTGAFAGTYVEGGMRTLGYYWSSERREFNPLNHAWTLNFSNGKSSPIDQINRYSARCVRSVPRNKP